MRQRYLIDDFKYIIGFWNNPVKVGKKHVEEFDPYIYSDTECEYYITFEGDNLIESDVDVEIVIDNYEVLKMGGKINLPKLEEKKIEYRLDMLDADCIAAHKKGTWKYADGIEKAIAEKEISIEPVPLDYYSTTGKLYFKGSWLYIDDSLYPSTGNRKIQTPESKEILFSDLDLRIEGKERGRFDEKISDTQLDNYLERESNMSLSLLSGGGSKVAYGQKWIPGISKKQFKYVTRVLWKDLITDRDRRILFYAYFKSTHKTIYERKYSKRNIPCPEWYIERRMNEKFPDIPVVSEIDIAIRPSTYIPEVLESKGQAIEEWHYWQKKAFKSIVRRKREKNLSNAQVAKKMGMKLEAVKKQLTRIRYNKLLFTYVSAKVNCARKLRPALLSIKRLKPLTSKGY